MVFRSCHKLLSRRDFVFTGFVVMSVFPIVGNLSHLCKSLTDGGMRTLDEQIHMKIQIDFPAGKSITDYLVDRSKWLNVELFNQVVAALRANGDIRHEVFTEREGGVDYEVIFANIGVARRFRAEAQSKAGIDQKRRTELGYKFKSEWWTT